MRDSDRGQAFTLEGFIASIVVLTAILFALQSVVITPTTTGAVDQEVQSDLRTQTQDALRVSAHNGTQNLTWWVRFWNTSDTAVTYAGATGPSIGYGSEEPFYLNDSMFGHVLNQSFTQRGRVYNVIVEYRNATNPNESEQLRVVYRGVPSDNAVVTTYTVALFDNMTLTGPSANKSLTLEAYGPRESAGSRPVFPIPDAFGQDYEDSSDFTGNPEGSGPYAPPGYKNDSPLYNIVEIRVIVW